MPIIQTYESRLGTSRHSRPVGAGPTFAPGVGALDKLGQVFRKRGEDLLQEYDTTRAMGAYSKLRDASRDKVNELLQREGASAQGIQTEYDEWHKKESGRIETDSLNVSRQRDMYSKLSARTRSADLDSLATHEARQHKAYKKEVTDGMFVILERDMPAVAFDDAKQDEMINDYFNSLDQLYPGHDLTVTKAGALQVFRVAAAKELISQNPEYAKTWLKSHKTELGDQYNVLMKSMEAQDAKNREDAATAILFNKHGENYAAAAAEILNPNNWKKFKIGGAEASKIALYFRTMISDRDRLEESQRSAYERQVKENDRAVILSWADDDVTNDIDVTDPKIRNTVSESLIKLQASRRKTEVEEDNWIVLDERREASMRGTLKIQDVIADVERGDMQAKTASALVKNDRNEEYKRGRHKLITALKPSEQDRRFQDKNLKMVEAEKSFEAKLASGLSPGEAADDVIAAYTGNIRRHARTLAKPKYLTKEVLRRSLAENRIDELNEVEQATARAFAAGLMSPNEYQEEMRLIERHKDVARQQQQIEDSEDQEKLKKAFKKNVKRD
jgi:hypothetical protein